MSRSVLFWPVPLVLGLCALLAAQPPGPGPRPYLGVGVMPANDSGEGVAIAEVAADSPAAKAGFKEGDIVVKVGGKDVADVTEFLRVVGAKKPGDKLEVKVRRGDKEQTITATLGQRPAGFGGGGGLPPGGDLKGLLKGGAFLGVQTEELTPERRKELKVKAEVGAVVTEVLPNSPAAKAGLQPNDVITAIDGQAVKDPSDLRSAVTKAGAGKDVMLRVQRGGEQRDLRASLAANPPALLPPPDGKLSQNVESLFDQAKRVRDLEKRIDALENRLKALEKQPSPK